MLLKVKEKAGLSLGSDHYLALQWLILITVYHPSPVINWRGHFIVAGAQKGRAVLWAMNSPTFDRGAFINEEFNLSGPLLIYLFLNVCKLFLHFNFEYFPGVF